MDTMLLFEVNQVLAILLYAQVIELGTDSTFGCPKHFLVELVIVECKGCTTYTWCGPICYSSTSHLISMKI